MQPSTVLRKPQQKVWQRRAKFLGHCFHLVMQQSASGFVISSSQCVEFPSVGTRGTHSTDLCNILGPLLLHVWRGVGGCVTFAGPAAG
jgi:hypothetical protein